MNKPVRVMFFPNGNTACFDEEGEQIPKLQESWFILYLQFLSSNGINPIDIEYDFPLGDKVSVFEIPNGYNWRILSQMMLKRRENVT